MASTSTSDKFCQNTAPHEANVCIGCLQDRRLQEERQPGVQVSTLCLLGRAYLLEEHLKKADGVLTQALLKDEHDRVVLSLNGAVLYKIGRPNRAFLAYALSLLETRIRTKEMWYNLGAACEMSGAHNVYYAIRAYQKYVMIDGAVNSPALERIAFLEGVLNQKGLPTQTTQTVLDPQTAAAAQSALDALPQAGVFISTVQAILDRVSPTEMHETQRSFTSEPPDRGRKLMITDTFHTLIMEG